jgi:hypothetical protein
MLIGPRCFSAMDDISHYREQANHLRQLAERTWQRRCFVTSHMIMTRSPTTLKPVVPRSAITN